MAGGGGTEEIFEKIEEVIWVQELQLLEIVYFQ